MLKEEGRRKKEEAIKVIAQQLITSRSPWRLLDLLKQYWPLKMRSFLLSAHLKPTFPKK
ncbi:MAG: hypothetical protein WCD53_31060 [Microcoleus sp.]